MRHIILLPHSLDIILGERKYDRKYLRGSQNSGYTRAYNFCLQWHIMNIMS